MMIYRLYYCDRDDRVTHFITLEAEDDQGALAKARAVPHRFNKEVWGGACKLAVLPGGEQARAA